MQIDDFRLPSHWASALINDDWTGYEDDEVDEIKDFLSMSGLAQYFCIDVADDASFQQCPSYWSSSYGLLAGSYSTFTFQIR